MLIGGFAASFRPDLIWASFIAIVLGFILSQYANYSVRRWGRSPRPDQVIEASLKGFDDRYHYYAWSLPQPYVLLSPQGIHVFTVRDQSGKITADGSNWKAKLNWRRIVFAFAVEGLGNPSQEAADHASRLTDWIKTRLPDFAGAAQPIILFTDPRVELEISQPPVPVLEPKNLKKWLRGTGKGDSLKAADLRALEELFNAEAARKNK